MNREPAIGDEVYDVSNFHEVDGTILSCVLVGKIVDLVDLSDIYDDSWKVWLSDDERDFTYINQKEAWSDEVNAWVVDYELAKEYGLL